MGISRMWSSSATACTGRPQPADARELSELLNAAATARFEPARAAGSPVSQNVVWLVSHTTVRAPLRAYVHVRVDGWKTALKTDERRRVSASFTSTRGDIPSCRRRVVLRIVSADDDALRRVCACPASTRTVRFASRRCRRADRPPASAARRVNIPPSKSTTIRRAPRTESSSGRSRAASGDVDRRRSIVDVERGTFELPVERGAWRIRRARPTRPP